MQTTLDQVSGQLPERLVCIIQALKPTLEPYDYVTHHVKLTWDTLLWDSPL